MAAQVEAERLLLVSELLGLGPWRRRGQGHAAGAVRGRAGRILVRRRQTAAPGRRCDRAAGARRARTPRRRPPAAAGAAPPTAAPRTAVSLASESKAPAFARLSNTRLLTSRRSRSSQSACSDRMRPCFARTSSSDVDRPFADVLDRGQAEADARAGVTVNRQLAFVDVRRQHRDRRGRGTRRGRARACRCSALRSSAAPRRNATDSSPSDTPSDRRGSAYAVECAFGNP